MTTIRKIVTSKIDGDTADNTNTSEIRPNNETAFYLDNDSKLTLMMFNGVRTHRKSKVLAPGVLWGSNADAGDGSQADTIKLIPDAELFAAGSNQYIVVDPTGGEPGHIHLRAGGTQDDSTADLYLGGEQNFVRISDTNDSVTIKTTVISDGENNYFWTFDGSGNLTFPNSAVIRTDGNNLEVGGVTNFNVEASGVVNIYTDTASETPYQWQFGDDGGLTLPDNGVVSAGGSGGLTLGGNFDVKIVADYTDNNRTWTFEGTDGSITFPDNTVQETAWAGGRVVSVPTHSYGAAGDLSGDLAFSNGYIYYCTQNYVPISSSVTTLASGPTFAYISSADYAGDLVADFTANSTGWTYNGVTITSVSIDNTFGPGYLLGADTSFSVVNENDYALVSPILSDIWKRVAWSGDTW